MIVKEQTKQLKIREGEFTDSERQVQSELTYANRENSRQQMSLESELKGLSNGCNESETTHFEHKIHQDKERAFDEEYKKRHDLEVTLVTDLKTKKTTERNQLDTDLDKIEKDFLAMREYQDALAETDKLREKIEADKVQIQFLDIKVNMMSSQTEEMNTKRDDLIEEKKMADNKNEELKTQLKAQEEIANKRLQNKLNREKSAEIKELLANEEMIKATNDDISNKFRAEKENYDQLMTSKMEIEEKLKRLTEDFKDDT